MAAAPKWIERRYAQRRRAASAHRFSGNLAEFNVYDQLVADGWTVLTRGWPDFLAYREGEGRLIEVKAGTDRVSHAQSEMFDALLGVFNIETEIVRPGENVRRARHGQ